jgi:hypothetical protein
MGYVPRQQAWVTYHVFAGPSLPPQDFCPVKEGRESPRSVVKQDLAALNTLRAATLKKGSLFQVKSIFKISSLKKRSPFQVKSPFSTDSLALRQLCIEFSL